ncbi:FRG domain-containing protein [Oceanospirillum sanctuarii]|uniref:FRG domain-containing protein n=1 Tax=Oceanospirillum sanctuarii TaxID=1434821 RepID=UPI001FE6A3FF|nr:FRG domain-containing protein [Oceanospirillum sanctuarii]
MKEAQLGSLRTLLGIIPELEDKDSLFFFRGHANKTYELKPSIYRKAQWISNENRIIREVIMRCPTEFSMMNSSFEKLVKMQHYDLPTRLLDLTENPLVALYFACVGGDENTEDGEIIFFKIPKSEVKYFDSDTVSVISNVAWANSDFEVGERFRGSSKAFHHNDNHHAVNLMHDIKQEKPHFLDRIDPKHIESIACVKPKMDNPRVVRQDGAFLLFGINGNKHSAASVPSNWIYRPSGKRYIVKASAKEGILKQLASVGISKAKLFPEIDMVSQFIKNEYGLDEIAFSSSIKELEIPKMKFKMY